MNQQNSKFIKFHYLFYFQNYLDFIILNFHFHFLMESTIITIILIIRLYSQFIQFH